MNEEELGKKMCKNGRGGKTERENDKKPLYSPPQIITYSEDEILEALGPAQACTPVVLVCAFPG